MATIVGTLSHEGGHYVVAELLGYDAFIHYGATSIGVPASKEVKEIELIWVTLGGILQTLLTGTVGLVILMLKRHTYFQTSVLSRWQWFFIFLSLFWLRQSANFSHWLGRIIFTGSKKSRSDEIELAGYFAWPDWSIMGVTGIIGFLILGVITIKFIPEKQRLTFLIAGLTGGVTGYFVWLKLLVDYYYLDLISIIECGH